MSIETLLHLPRYGTNFRGCQYGQLVAGQYFSHANGSGGCQLIAVTKTFKNGKIQIQYLNSNGTHKTTVDPEAYCDTY